MSKPSIFSKNYEKRMKRRRLNIILILLIILCIGFFGGKYILNKKNINLLPDFTSKKQSEPKKNEKTNKKTSEEKKEETSSANVLEYTYTLKNNKPLKVEYTVQGDKKEIKAFKNENLESIEYAISPNKQNAVFVDKTDQSLILVDVNGNFTNITKPNISYNNGKKLTRKILETKQDYIWNAKPQFTSEGNIVYISDMPNSKPGLGYTLWTTKPSKDSSHKKVTKLNKDLESNVFEGFDENGRLKLKTNDEYIYISSDGYSVEK